MCILLYVTFKSKGKPTVSKYRTLLECILKFSQSVQMSAIYSEMHENQFELIAG